jgi:hypothetical protein
LYSLPADVGGYPEQKKEGLEMSSLVQYWYISLLLGLLAIPIMYVIVYYGWIGLLYWFDQAVLAIRMRRIDNDERGKGDRGDTTGAQEGGE